MLLTWRTIAIVLGMLYGVSLLLWVTGTMLHLEDLAQNQHRTNWHFRISSQTKSHETPHDETPHDSQIPHTSPLLNPVNPVLYMNNYIPENYVNTGFNLAKACDITSGNIGNLVWMYGGSILFKMNPVHDFIFSAFGDPNLPIYNAQAFFFPVANILQNSSVFHREGSDSINKTVHRTIESIASVNGPVLLVGVGTQGFYNADHTFYDLEPAKTIEDVSTYHLEKPHMDLLDTIRSRGGFIMARGEYTASVLRSHGFNQVAVAGCPSLFVNPMPKMGVQMALKLANLERRVRKKEYVRIVVTLPPYYKPKIIKLFLVLLLANRQNRLIIQDMRDMQTLKTAETHLKLTVPSEQIAWFTSVAAWREFMYRFDFILSGRIHGMMLALSTLVPGFVIAPDWRVKELVQSMMLPYADPFQEWLRDLSNLESSSALLNFVSKARTMFDGAAFDKNRCCIYRMYEKIFKEMRFELNPDLAAVCEFQSQIQCM